MSRDIFKLGDSFKPVPQTSIYHIRPFSAEEWAQFIEADADEAKAWIKERMWKEQRFPIFRRINDE